MRCAKAKAEQGFTLLEIVLSIGLLMLATGLLASAFGPWMAFRQSMETDRKLKEVQQALAAAYKENALSVDNADGEALTFPSGAIASGSTTTAALMQPLARYAGLSPAQMASDGFNRPYRVLVSGRLQQSVSGISLYYHMAAVVSAGRNGKWDNATRLDSKSGELTLGGDDQGVVVDGYRIARAHYEDTLARMNKIASVYQTYFSTRYLSDLSRNVAIDYFAQPCATSVFPAQWDAGGGVANTCSAMTALDAAGAHAGLGFAATDVVDSYGQALQIDNSSPGVRSPDNPIAAMASPPYTAAVATSLPGGYLLRVSMAGTY
jgi:type II secretory pathway pseudopilin PulG